METANQFYDWLDNWKVNRQNTFIKLAEGLNKDQLEGRFDQFIVNHFPVSPESPDRLYLYPLLDFHLKSILVPIEINMRTSHPADVYLFLITGVLVILVVCFNFMNMTTARSLTRAKEVGMRKVAGANRRQLAYQFLSESLVFSFLSMPFAIALYELFIGPGFLILIGLTDLRFSLFDYPELLAYLLGIVFFVGIASGSYPALYLSRFSPVKVIKGSYQQGSKGSRLRKILVVVQFAFSFILIVFSVVMQDQFEYIISMDLGYNKENVMTINLTDGSKGHIKKIKAEFEKHADVTYVTTSNSIPFDWSSPVKVIPEGFDSENTLSMDMYGVGLDFIETLDLNINSGRSFSLDYSDDNSFIINESAAKLIKRENPIGMTFEVDGKKGKVIGVVSDYVFRSLYFGLDAAILHLAPENMNYMLVKLSKPMSTESVDYLKSQWNIITDHQPFEYALLQDKFTDTYEGVKQAATMFSFVGLVTIFYSCIGLMGLAYYTVERKTKEIGLRKVLGASTYIIQSLIMKEFLILIMIGNIIIMPLTHYLLLRLLEFGWTYPVEISISVFVYTALLTLVLSFLSIIFQSTKASLANPVDSLRCE